jgi:hypothetical protein
MLKKILSGTNTQRTDIQQEEFTSDVQNGKQAVACKYRNFFILN